MRVRRYRVILIEWLSVDEAMRLGEDSTIIIYGIIIFSSLA